MKFLMPRGQQSSPKERTVWDYLAKFFRNPEFGAMTAQTFHALPSATYTPTLTNMAVGTGGSARNDATYRYSGGIICIYGIIVFGTAGTTFPGAGVESISMPSGFALLGVSAIHPIGWCSFSQASSGQTGLVRPISTVAFRPVVINPAVAYNNVADITATVPFTWAAGDSIIWNVTALANEV